MPSDPSAWNAVAITAAITWISRVAGALMMGRIAMSPGVVRFLDGLSIAVISALLASMLAQSGVRALAAVGVTSLITLRWKSPFWAMAGGILLASIWFNAFHP